MSIEEKIDLARWEPPNMKTVQQLEGNPLVTCSCGRKVNADMMRVSGKGFACDSCQDTEFRTGRVTREAFAVSQAAPIAVVEKARSQDAARIAVTAPSSPLDSTA